MKAGLLPKKTKMTRHFLLETIGNGVSGEVYLAFDQFTSRQVVLKTIPRGANRAQRRALLTETHLLKAFTHASILPVLTCGYLTDGRPYYTMPWVEGQTLRQKMQDPSFSLHEGVQCLERVSEALSYAHGFGIVHCDVKPANILIAKDGSVFLIDWGTVEVLTSENKIGKNKEQTERVIKGTPFYIAPELIRGEAISPKADLYAIGVILYELLTGRHPFLSKDVYALFAEVCTKEVLAPSSVLDRLQRSENVESICLQLLSKSPAKRFYCSKSVSYLLRRWLLEEASSRYLKVPWPTSSRAESLSSHLLRSV